jgi:hypothetical protein
VRELIYLSNSKMQQFLPDRPPRWRRIGRLRAEIKAPVGSISVEPELPDNKAWTKADDLNKVTDYIEQNFQWFTSEEVRAGEWIYFEDWLNYRVFRPHRRAPIVLFYNLNYHETGHTRLLLHGSAEHLRGSAPAEGQLRLERLESPSPSDGPWFRDMLPILPKLIDKLATRPVERTGIARGLEWDIKDVVQALDESNISETAAWLTGYARVTARIVPSSGDISPGGSFVVASPLYVEAQPPPADDEDS